MCMCVCVCVCVCVYIKYFVLTSTLRTCSYTNPITEALKTYRECREKEPTLQKELNEVNNETERKCKEIELTVPMRIKWTPRMRLTPEQMNTLPHTHTLPNPQPERTPHSRPLSRILLLNPRSDHWINLLNLQWRCPNQWIRDNRHRKTFEKIPEVVSMPHVDSDEFEDDDEQECGYMGIPIEDDDDSDSDTSGNLVIQMPRSRSREDDNFDNDYVPDTASGGN